MAGKDAFEPYPAYDDQPLDNVQAAAAALRGFMSVTLQDRAVDDHFTVRAGDLFFLLQPAINRLCVAQQQLTKAAEQARSKRNSA